MSLMTRIAAAVAMLFAMFATAAYAAPDDATFDRLLARYVVAGDDGVNRVNYAAWKANAADRKALNTYVSGLEKTAISKLSRNEQFAAWANLYNAVTLQVILDRHPVKSIRDIKSTGTLDLVKAAAGPWATKRVTVEGKKLSLDDIEHGILRATYKDPRVHYAVNCASYGCPNLPRKAWRAATLSADLDAAAREYVNHPRGAMVMGGSLEVSSIYKWFKADFGGNDAGVIAHLKKYANPALAGKLANISAISGDDYSWALNDTGSNS